MRNQSTLALCCQWLPPHLPRPEASPYRPTESSALHCALGEECPSPGSRLRRALPDPGIWTGLGGKKERHPHLLTRSSLRGAGLNSTPHLARSREAGQGAPRGWRRGAARRRGRGRGGEGAYPPCGCSAAVGARAGLISRVSVRLAACQAVVKRGAGGRAGVAVEGGALWRSGERRPARGAAPRRPQLHAARPRRRLSGGAESTAPPERQGSAPGLGAWGSARLRRQGQASPGRAKTSSAGFSPLTALSCAVPSKNALSQRAPVPHPTPSRMRTHNASRRKLLCGRLRPQKEYTLK